MDDATIANTLGALLASGSHYAILTALAIMAFLMVASHQVLALTRRW